MRADGGRDAGVGRLLLLLLLELGLFGGGFHARRHGGDAVAIVGS